MDSSCNAYLSEILNSDKSLDLCNLSIFTDIETDDVYHAGCLLVEGDLIKSERLRNLCKQINFINKKNTIPVIRKTYELPAYKFIGNINKNTFEIG
ncbi:MAG: hypothetical protein WC011_01910 [Candidatus Paceibacterota bacterium]